MPQIERFTFPGHSGQELAARLDCPNRPIRAVALMAHCFTCSKDIVAARRITARLVADGFAVLRFDFTGLGHSGGEFANSGFTANVGDLTAAAAHMAERGLAPSLLIGHSLGGAAVIAAAPRIESAKSVVTIGAPAEPAHVLHHLGSSVEAIEREGEAEVLFAGRPFRVTRAFVEDISSASIEDALRDLRAALLVLHAPRDDTVGIGHATRIFTAARHPKSFVTLDDADHLLSRPADAEYAAEVITAWARRYLDLPQEVVPLGAPEGITRVMESDPDGFLQDILAGPRHHLNADEPRAVGGTDQGPGPYQLVAAGLGACTSMTIRMYARRKGWPLTHVAVDVMHAKSHAEDAGNPAAKTSKIDIFDRAIRIEGDLTEEQRQRLLEIANKCPVHRTLEASSRIRTRLEN